MNRTWTFFWEVYGLLGVVFGVWAWWVDRHNITGTVIKTQGDPVVGGLQLGVSLGNGKVGSDVRDTAVEEQEVLAHQSAEGVRQRTRRLELEFWAWVVGRMGLSLEKIGYLGMMIDLFSDVFVWSTLKHPHGSTCQAGMQVCKGIHRSEKKIKLRLQR